MIYSFGISSSDKTGRFQYDQRIIAYYGNREPRRSPAAWRGNILIGVMRSDFVSIEDMSHVLQLMDELVNASAPDGSKASSPI